jgi:hypothetical protein
MVKLILTIMKVMSSEDSLKKKRPLIRVASFFIIN